MTAMAVAVVGYATPAFAIQWGSQSSPYIAYDNKVAQAKGWGDYGNYNNQYARDNSYQYDPKAGGEGVYVHVEFGFFPSTGYTGSYKETARTTTSSWVFKQLQVNLSSSSEKARGTLTVCEDNSFSWDPCSAAGYVTFSY
ncbi:hypothetical protein [Paractinoplanes ferrugineus]|uniref:Secreted protein n=1 Tax=Paractinoplanes ferrugineus TaxID=113564 RepID=A0A919J504_9ACTN|nr:hypothetical protein [Actinoplanes ferrugineus]GIE13123.1 hypothetical protein Afe05nite_49630 [Actinoplanes ferrugineus]